VLVRGSTHADGSWLVATQGFPMGGFFFMDTSHVDMRNLGFSGSPLRFIGSGLVLSNITVSNGMVRLLSDYSSFIDLKVNRGTVELSGLSNTVQRMIQRWGETIILGTNLTVQNSVIFTTNNARTALVVNAVGAVVSNCTVVSTRGSALAKLGFGTLRAGHNILVAGGSHSNSVIEWVDGNLLSDWNNLWARDSAWVGAYNGKWERLAYWQAVSGRDANSVAFDPLFQNEADGDFHLNSLSGRWSTVFNTWDQDGEHSPVIDLGDPWIGTASEPLFNGYRRNLGAYGGTVQASKSITNLWLTALTANDGGVLRGTNVVLRWAAGNAGGKTVALQYFNGTDWVDIATGLSANEGSYAWDSTGFPDGFSARWRVIAEDGSGVYDETDTAFALRNNPHEFFVNDTGPTEDDIYCSAVGDDANSGLSNSAPKRTLQALLDTYDLEGGDVVYMDSGTYPATNDIQIIWSRSGLPGAPVVIQGNTNGAHTILTRSGNTNFPAVGIDVKASHVELAHLVVRGVDRGILLESNRSTTVQGVVVSEANSGIVVAGAMDTRIRNSALWKTGWGVEIFNARTSVIENVTFALQTLAGIRLTNTLVDTLQNNIFIPAEGAFAYAVGTETSLLSSATLDYNLYDLSLTNTAIFAGHTNEFRRYQNMLQRDYRSAITNADLVDAEWTGDFHPKSEYGRWTPGGWTEDETTSWAVDHGSPCQRLQRGDGSQRWPHQHRHVWQHGSGQPRQHEHLFRNPDPE
jgi:hypothetical protein